ncbi:membrane protein YfhO [Prevotella sp. tc2-28]|uniref:YfhO family protein n=1 Tax=Prevotella sp. tc2-28 TaxID=1761888 RepID=UPI00089B1243|nr:YfhO family protein [Prevotella sp. tc2-28]SDZ94861.1 membrane protein YfhO [Prevotella sp. tc2-28]
MKSLKQWLPEVLVVILFVGISFAYFFPADIEGRILYRHDSSAVRGAGQEAHEYQERTGEVTRWTNALFGGMPTYQTAPSYRSMTTLNKVTDAYHLWLPENVWYVFVYLLGFYILLRAFDFRWYLATLGAIIWAFSSYFFIIIAAGHIWKVMALAYLPPMIAGIVLAYRGKYLWGLVVTTIFAAFEIKANHVQMTYYYLFVIAAMVIAYMIEGIRQKNYRHLLKATAVCVVAALIAICLNISNLYHTWQYSKESMRSASELVKKNASNQTSSGLDRDYITQWSYGIDETWTLLVPNTKGGASVPLSDSKIAMQHADNYYLGIYQQLGQYWGNQPMTAGPVYVGAFVLMLFVLGLFIVKGPMKWALLTATILSILLSWGRNFMPFTDFFLDYVPMYAKFRTVASILVIAEFTIPLLAMLALKKIVDEPELLKKKAKWLYVSFALTGGVALLFALMPKVFFPDFISVSELQAMAQIPADQAVPLMQNLTEMRVAVFTADCWRSFWIIVIGTACLLLYKYRKMRVEWMTAALVVLCLFDMWQVNKRYLNDSMFVPATVREEPVTKTQAIDHILQDKSLDFRVLNLATSTFNENETSFYLKSIGGYHAAKLRRYQELVDAYIQKEMSGVISAISKAGGDMTQVKGDSVYPVLNMLNTKYFILPLQGGQSVPLENPYTYGNAWFVNHVRYVANANEELDAIGSLDLRHEAVADQKFKEQLGESVPQDTVSLSFVRIKTYEPNQLTYEVESTKGGIVVFSEIYYPGWTATVDGVEQALGRVNYVLRALQVKPGKHEVVLSFFPKSIDHTETIAYISYVVLLLLILWLGWTTYRRRRQA